MSSAKFGIFSWHDPWLWAMEDDAVNDIKTLEDIVRRLSRLDGIEFLLPSVDLRV